MSLTVVPLRAVKAPVLAGPMTFEDEKPIVLAVREVELSPTFSVPANVPDGTLMLAENGELNPPPPRIFA